MKMTWTLHNQMVHPICAMMRFLGMKKRARRFHDNHMPDEIECILWEMDGMAGIIVGKEPEKPAKGKGKGKGKRKHGPAEAGGFEEHRGI